MAEAKRDRAKLTEPTPNFSASEQLALSGSSRSDKENICLHQPCRLCTQCEQAKFGNGQTLLPTLRQPRAAHQQR